MSLEVRSHWTPHRHATQRTAFITGILFNVFDCCGAAVIEHNE